MKIKIKTDSINKILKLVAEASKIDGDVLCSRGRICVDAKSLMGLMSLKIDTGAVIEFPESATEFEEFLRNENYIVE